MSTIHVFHVSSIRSQLFVRFDVNINEFNVIRSGLVSPHHGLTC